MKKIKLICATVIVLAGCMAKPKQPPLTEKEARYINELALSCHCDVRRELDPRKPEERAFPEEDWYAITFNKVPCSSLSQKDSLRLIGLQIAKRLHKEVLKDDFKYPYKHITVSFVCNINSTIQTSESFQYQLQELDGK